MNTTIASAITSAVATIGTTALLAASPVGAQSLPSYATASSDRTITGTIASIDGKYHLSVRDTHGYIDDVSLHAGTIINPTGLTLAPGQSVTILGKPQGRTFVANQIDTPYQRVGLYPVYRVYPVYPGWGWGPPPYPYYHVGVGFGRDFRFGMRG